VSDIAWRVHTIEPTVRVRVVRPMPALSAPLEAEVERLWMLAQARDGSLFNGRVFSTDQLSPTLIEGHWTEYRRIVARIARPELATEMPVAPTAVGGVIVGGPVGQEFVLFGRRPANAVYQAGQWQLPPAGSLDPGAANGDELDPVRQLLAELHEELGLPADAVSDPRPLCVVQHPGSGVLDFGIAVRTHWTAAAIMAAHATARDREYDPLETVPLAGLPAFLARHAGHVTRQAFAFLTHAKLLAGA
jgi:8-oxo-dGTP pyrophosphatase MutT (NUDIX family)